MRKTIKITNQELFNHVNLMTRITESFNGAVQYAISRTKKTLLDEFETFAKSRDEAKKQYCKLDKEGNLVLNEKETDHVYLSKEAKKQWGETIDKLLEEEIEVEIRTIKTEDIFDKDVSPVTMDALLFMLEDEGE